MEFTCRVRNSPQTNDRARGCSALRVALATPNILMYEFRESTTRQKIGVTDEQLPFGLPGNELEARRIHLALRRGARQKPQICGSTPLIFLGERVAGLSVS